MALWRQLGMRAGRTDLRPYAGVVWGIIVAGGLVLGSTLGLLPAAPDAWTHDWRTAYLSPRATEQHHGVALVIVDEDTLARYPARSPVDRRLIAELLKAIDNAGPKAIGLDFIFDRTADAGATVALVKSLKEAKAPVVIGAVDKREAMVKERNLELQSQLLAQSGQSSGHVYFARQDGRLTIPEEVVRSRLPPPLTQGERASLAEVLALKTGVKASGDHRLIAWVLPPRDQSSEIFATLRVPEHEPSQATADRILPKSWRAALKDKVVLVGGEFVDRDQHLTPLSVVRGERMPGVRIHAQILAQLLDGRSVGPISPLTELLLLIPTAIAGFFAGRRWRLHRYRKPVYFCGLLILALVGAALFHWFGLILSTMSFLLAWLLGISGGHHCEWVLRRAGIGRVA